MSFGTRNACGVFDFQRENFALRNNDYINYYYQANIFRLNVGELLHFPIEIRCIRIPSREFNYIIYNIQSNCDDVTIYGLQIIYKLKNV